jgi:hypothetical protein
MMPMNQEIACQNIENALDDGTHMAKIQLAELLNNNDRDLTESQTKQHADALLISSAMFALAIVLQETLKDDRD